MARAFAPNARSKGRGDPWLKLARKSKIAALARTVGVTTGERAAMQVRPRQRAIAGRERGVREIGVREIGGSKLILTVMGEKRTSQSN